MTDEQVSHLKLGDVVEVRMDWPPLPVIAMVGVDSEGRRYIVVDGAECLHRQWNYFELRRDLMGES